MDRKQTIVAGFTVDPQKFLHLGHAARHEGFRDLDCIMPYPVHGFEEAYGLKWSWVGLVALIALLTGWAGGFSMQAFIMYVDYPINVGGKPHIAWPAFIPVTFECGILLSGLTTLVSIIFAGKLLPHPCLKVIRERCTDDLFAILIPVESDSEKARAEEFLKTQGISETDCFDPALLSRTQCGIACKSS